MVATKGYKASDIKVLEGLEAVRIRPGMYIGSTGSKGLHHILWEIVDNAIDEAANGFASKIEVRLKKDGSASVEDNGRGIPTDIHPKLGVSGVEVVFTKLHAGGKFDESNYAYSGGLHGVGASVTNALSEWLSVEVYKGTVYKMNFKSYYDEKKKKFQCGIPTAKLKNTGKATKKKGTYVCFKPDANVFETIEFKFETVSKRLNELAFLNKGVEIKLIDERLAEKKVEVYKYEGGVSDFVKYLNEGKSTLYKTPLYYKGEKNGIVVEFAIQHTDEYSENMYSFVNNIPTAEGGFHEQGFRSGITRTFNSYAQKNNIIKDKDLAFIGDDFKEGFTAVLSIRMQNVQFEGQTKTKLGNPEARLPVEQVTIEGLNSLADVRGTKAAFDAILKKAQNAAKARQAAKHAKEVARAKSSLEGLTLVGKLASCTGKKPELNELFIVEGDSAGGTAKQARIRQFQSILPLRGKPLNVEKKRIDQVLANEEMRTLISALGAGLGNDFDLSSLNYHKVIILSDADQDGMHIRCILLTFFYRYMKDLVTNGHVYIGMPPLYKVYKNNVEEYAYNDDDLNKAIAKVGKGYKLQRYKGLGEMSSEQLWDTTMNPETRNLMKVTVEDAAEADRTITTLMGDSVDLRKEFIAKNANFNKIDNFIEKVNL